MMLESNDATEVAERFSLGENAVLAGPVARGEVGRVWRLSTSLGTFAVKEPFEAAPLDEICEHAAFQEAACAAGIPAPAVIRADDGSALADVRGAQVRVFEWIDLLERDARVDPAEVGGIVASIHGIGFAGNLPTDPWYTDPVGASRWDMLVSELHARGAPFAPLLAAMRDELVALEGLLDAPRDLQTCHRDLWADNVLRTGRGGLCVIDWENCGLADPGQELALVLFEFGLGVAERVQALYDAYVENGGPGRIERPADFSMLVAQLGHIGEDACSRWLDPNLSDVERERQSVRAAEFLALPLTRASVEETLALLSG
jgi:Ser/Thr protein kinase RdoA (MazF antagonist)